MSVFLSDGDMAQGSTRQPATHTPGHFEVHGTKKFRVSPKESVMTSDAKYEVSQFWSLEGFHRLNSGAGELALGLLQREKGRLGAWLGLLRVQRGDFSNRPVSRDPHTGSTACPGGLSAGRGLLVFPLFLDSSSEFGMEQNLCPLC